MELARRGPGFAAEVRGVGLADVAESEEAYRAVREAFEAESVLVFRGEAITDELQLAFSRRFGPLETVKVASLGEGGHFSILSNVVDGRIVPPTHRQALVARANQLWHTDSSFKRTPALASVLSARIIPEHGGETEFASTRLAWERLPEETRARLKDAFAWHDYAHSRGRIDPELATPAERAALPPVCWRMAWTNPANGRTALYVASHAFAIEGMEPREAAALLGRLIDEATRPEFTYLHRWEAGDVVMWDNRATMHRGRSWPDDLPRDMRRTTISATDADGLAAMRPPPRAA